MPRLSVNRDSPPPWLSSREVRAHGGDSFDESLSEGSTIVLLELTARQSGLGRESKWDRVSQTSLESVSRLRDGWDGFGAMAPAEESLRTALSVLRNVPNYAPQPRVAATADGGIQIEWYRERMDITLDIMGPENVTLYWRDALTEWEGPLGESPEQVAKLLWRFVST